MTGPAEVAVRRALEAVVSAYDDEASYVGFTLTQGTLEQAIDTARVALSVQPVA